MKFEVKNLCFSYYKKPLCLKDVNFSASGSEKILLLATKDSGKTTILKTISGFETHYFGEVFADKREIRLIDDESKNFSFLPANPVVLKHKSIKKNLDYLSKITGKTFDENNTKRLFDEFGLNCDFSKKLSKMSLCEQRIFAMIRSVLKNPDILFLDNQFENIDGCELKKIEHAIRLLFEKFKNIPVIFAVDDIAFKNSNTFFEDLKFDKFLFLSRANVRGLKTIDCLKNELPNLESVRFFDGFEQSSALLTHFEDGYYVCFDSEKTLKLNSKFNKNLDELGIKIFENEKIIIISETGIIVDEFSDEDFNKNLAFGAVKIYLYFDGTRLIWKVDQKYWKIKNYLI